MKHHTQNEKIVQVDEQTLVVGIEHFRDWVVKNMTAHGKQKIMAGLEPTGQYWFPLG